MRVCTSLRKDAWTGTAYAQEQGLLTLPEMQACLCKTLTSYCTCLGKHNKAVQTMHTKAEISKRSVTHIRELRTQFPRAPNSKLATRLWPRYNNDVPLHESILHWAYQTKTLPRPAVLQTQWKEWEGQARCSKYYKTETMKCVALLSDWVSFSLQPCQDFPKPTFGSCWLTLT